MPDDTKGAGLVPAPNAMKEPATAAPSGAAAAASGAAASGTRETALAFAEEIHPTDRLVDELAALDAELRAAGSSAADLLRSLARQFVGKF